MSHTPKVPKGWHLSGSSPGLYRTEVVPEAFGTATAVHLAGSEATSGFGTFMQAFKADAFRGQRVRYSAAVRSDNVDQWAGLWLRVDGKESYSLAFDNMQDRPIHGTTEWRRHAVVLDVPEEATKIVFGILLTGRGDVWITDVNVEPVGADIAVTGKPRTGPPELPDAPVNLDFAEVGAD